MKEKDYIAVHDLATLRLVMCAFSSVTSGEKEIIQAARLVNTVIQKLEKVVSP